MLRSLFLAASIALAGSAEAIVLTEPPDFADDPMNPTSFILDSGTNSISGSTVVNDFDILSFVVPVSLQLDSLVLSSYSSEVNRSFVALQTGPSWTAGLGGAVDPAAILGWAHFAPENVGNDLFPIMTNQFGTIGFTAPLSSGVYSLLIQETGPSQISYGFDLNVSPVAAVPEPGSIVLWSGMLLVAGVLARRRASSS